jgi:hypothetical protein
MKLRKKTINSGSFILVLIFIWMLFPIGGISQVNIQEEDNKVFIENNWIKIYYDLVTGTLSAINKNSGVESLSDCYCEINSIYGTIRTTDTGYERSWEKESVNDLLGKGEKLILYHTKRDIPTLIYEITIYEDESFIVLNAGVKNANYPITLRRISVLEGTLFKGSDLTENFVMLDGNGGADTTKVWNRKRMGCLNNMLVTFGYSRSKTKTSAVLGGLTYHDFEKFVTIDNQDSLIIFSIKNQDPVGKLVDANDKYIPDDKFYFDFITKDPFESLEKYGHSIRVAQNIDLNMYDFPTLCLWYSGHERYGNGQKNNNTVGGVWEMEQAVKSGFLKYSRLGIRLVPDNYEDNNQNGWWNDIHYQQLPNTVSTMGPCNRQPYETIEKWGKKIKELGGLPFMYSQTGRRSEDYCQQFPGHMLFNDPYSYYKSRWRRGDIFIGYDFTDPDFISHLHDVYQNWNKGGIKGMMFDYPKGTGWAAYGGFEDKYATTSSAYRNIFRIAKEGLGNDSYIHERAITKGMGSDISLGTVSSQRIIGDADKVTPITVSKAGLRWYKNRVVVNYDSDAKNPYHVEPNNRDGVRAMLTMTYVTIGRFLLGQSFSKMTEQQFYDLTRIFPFHTTHKSARPVDAFSDKEYPEVYDFKINDKWHQLTFYNTAIEGGEWKEGVGGTEAKAGTLVSNVISVELGDSLVEGGLGLNPGKQYYIYDFWNDSFIGKIEGKERLEQILRPGEARMMSIHEVEEMPQFISTNRHVMQGYVDMTKYPEWNDQRKELSGISKVVGGEEYVTVIALNGYKPVSCSVPQGNCEVKITDTNNGICKLFINNDKNIEAEWTLRFEDQ